MSVSKKEMREVAQTAKSATSFMRRALRAANISERVPSESFRVRPSITRLDARRVKGMRAVMHATAKSVVPTTQPLTKTESSALAVFPSQDMLQTSSS